MTTVQETAYPRLKADPTPKDLASVYTPIEAELAFVRTMASNPRTQFTALLHLKLFQRLGYFVPLAEVPEPIVRHIKNAVSYRRAFTTAQRKAHDISGTRRQQLQAIRRLLEVRSLDEDAEAWLTGVAETAAQTKHLVADIINVLLEELVHHRYELPAFSRLERIATEARETVHEAYFARIGQVLTPAARQLIDRLLTTPPGATRSGWHDIKREPKRPTNKEIRFYLQHVRQLKALAEQLPVIDLPIPKLKYFRTLARALDAGELTALKPAKRYALATLFILSQYGKTLDDAADLFIRLVRNLENTAQQKLITYQLDHSKRADLLIGQLKDILQAYRLDGTDSQRVDAIENAMTTDIEVLLAECDEHMAYAGKNFLPFLLTPYGSRRPLLLNCLEIMQLRASTKDLTTERLLQGVLALRGQKRSWVDITMLGLDSATDLAWMSANWRRHVLAKTADPRAPGQHWVHRKYLELAILFHVKAELESGDLYIPEGDRYDDYREQFVDESTYQRELPGYGQVAGISTDAATFVQQLHQRLVKQCEAVDARFPNNVHADIVDHRLVLKRQGKRDSSDAVKRLDCFITERLAPTSVVDVLIDTTRWLNLSRHFKPLAGTESQLNDLDHRVVTTLFCYGCNLGPAQTARSVRGLSRRQVAWLNLKYVAEDTLERATVDVINTYNRFELPGYWGSGKSASADGTKWHLYEQNLLSEYHIRYGGYGGIGYYHVSDKYIALFSHFIPCGVYEAVYILDGLMANQSDIQPDQIHGDTQSQSYPVFALAHLLGIQLMPRIRNIKDLILFKPESGQNYLNIQSLFGDAAINWDLIETHFHDMLRVAISIKQGRITASTILRRLGTRSRKNKLYYAFRELGRVMRTLFLLRYIDDADLRMTIQAETNKSEEFNGFTKWVFFGGEGVIAENVQHEQRKIVRYNQLVSNLIILHNVEQMTRVLAKLREEGMEITAEMLAGLSPYRNGHLNRFGDYTVDTKRDVPPLDVSRRILLDSGLISTRNQERAT